MDPYQTGPEQAVTQKLIIERGLRQTCPNCGQSKLFLTKLKIHLRCPSCGMTLARGDGFYLGPSCLNYGFVAFFVVSPLILAGFAGWISLKLALVLATACAFLLPFALYRFFWSLWLTLYYMCLPNELHANRPADSDDLLFEEEPRINNQ